MLLDAMTGEPEWCGALAAVSLHRQTLKKGEERGGKEALLKHRNLRKKREKEQQRGDEAPGARRRFATKNLGFL